MFSTHLLSKHEFQSHNNATLNGIDILKNDSTIFFSLKKF